MIQCTNIIWAKGNYQYLHQKKKNPDDVDEFLIFQSDNTTEVECSCEIDYTGNGIVCVS